MRPCVIRELSRPNEALTYLGYRPPSFSSLLLRLTLSASLSSSLLCLVPLSRDLPYFVVPIFSLLPGDDASHHLSSRFATLSESSSAPMPKLTFPEARWSTFLGFGKRRTRERVERTPRVRFERDKAKRVKKAPIREGAGEEV